MLAARLRPLPPPRYTSLKRELDRDLAYYDFDRLHHGRLTRGRIPADIVYAANKMKAREANRPIDVRAGSTARRPQRAKEPKRVCGAVRVRGTDPRRGQA